MDIGNKFTKQQERKAMLDMLKQRESAIPNHADSIWAHNFWSRRLDEYAEVKRVLGVGMATMSDHLRMYKDPFESSEPQFELIPLEVDSWSRRIQAVDVDSHQPQATLDFEFPDGMHSEFDDD